MTTKRDKTRPGATGMGLARRSPFFLPLILLGAYLNIGGGSGGSGGPPAPDTPPVLTQPVSCFPSVEVAGEVLPAIPAERSVNVYRDGALINSLLSDPQGAFVWQDRSCDLAVDTLYSYHFTYTSTGGESPASPAAEITLVPELVDCGAPPPACSGDTCTGGLTSISAPADQATPLSVTVTSTTPGMTVQFEAVTNPTGRYWVPVGPPITTDTPVCLSGQAVYEASADISIPGDIWQAGSWHTTLRGRIEGGSDPEYIPWFADWAACTAAADPDTPLEQLFSSCPFGFFSPYIIVGPVFLSGGTAPTVAITDLTCRSARVSGVSGTATIFLDGLPVHGYGSTDHSLPYLMPGETYEVQVASFVGGVNGPLSAPVTFTTPDCVPPGSAADFDLGISLVVFQGVTAELPYTRQEFEDWVFNNDDSFRAYIEEISRGQITVTGQVYGWLVFPGNVADYCEVVLEDGTGVAPCPGARPAVLDWVPPTVQTHDVVIFFGAGPGGGINFGNLSVINNRRGHPIAPLAHEAFGHGLTNGMHSGGLVCPSSSLEADPMFAQASGCTGRSLGDLYDPLGPPNEFHFNMYNLHRFGLLSISDTERATDVEGGSSEHWIGALNSPAYPKKLLKVPLDKGGLILLEFRNQFGFDGTLPCLDCDPPRPNVSNAANIIPAPVGLQVRLHLPVELADWKTSFPLLGLQPPYLYRPNGGQALVLNTSNPVFDEMGVRIEVLQQNVDGIRVRVEQ